MKGGANSAERIFGRTQKSEDAILSGGKASVAFVQKKW